MTFANCPLAITSNRFPIANPVFTATIEKHQLILAHIDMRMHTSEHACPDRLGAGRQGGTIR